MTNTISPCLWFDNQAEEAMNFYLSVFEDSEVVNVSRYGDAGPGAEGSVLVATFRLNKQQFMVLNGGPHFTFSEATSFHIDCETQEEVDYYWEKLSDGGEKSQCGWLKDKFGLSWQVVPTILGKMMQDEDKEKANRVMQAMLQMTKIDIAKLQQAYDGP
jgi:predicted 3-demethylubiquinone-9 3-methyltransferase (glyoxalase superfamily)